MVTAILVEDDNEFRKSVKRILSSRYPFLELSEAENGDQALRSIDHLPPDLIILDIHLPGKNGLQVAREIKDRHPNTVIIMLTNYDLPEYRESAFRSGANYFVSKDSSIADFFTLIEWITENGVKS